MNQPHSPENHRRADHPIEPAFLWCWLQETMDGESLNMPVEQRGREISSDRSPIRDESSELEDDSER